MAENVIKRTVAYQVTCRCSKETIHNEKADVMECAVCHATELLYVIEREGRIKEVAPVAEEKSAQEKIKDIQRAQQKAVSGVQPKQKAVSK